MTIVKSNSFNNVMSNVENAVEHLYDWLAGQLEPGGLAWVDAVKSQLSTNASDTFLFTRFSMVPRKVGKSDLRLTDAHLQMPQKVRVGWQPEGWSVDQGVRTLLLLSFPTEDADRYVATIERLFSAADVAEQIALYQSLPLLPYPERFKLRAIEGLRSNITSVFNAIALHNPYPADYFDEAAWNQMVLKAFFVDSHVSQIYDLDRRANQNLAHMLSDYAHERWAAGRTVNPQLWRLIGPFAEGDLVTDLERVLDQGEPFEQHAAALAFATAKKASTLLDKTPELKQKIMEGRLTWTGFSVSYP